MASAAFGLDFGDDEGAFAARDPQTVSVGLQDLPWKGPGLGVGVGDGGVDLEDAMGSADGDRAEGAGPWREGAETSPEHLCGQGPIDATVFAGDPAGVGDALGRLRDGGKPTGDPFGQVLDDQGSAEIGEAVVEGLGIVVVLDGSSNGCDDRAGVEA